MLFISLICINISDLLESESHIIDYLRKYMVDCEKKNNRSDISTSILEKRSILKYAFFPIL